MCIIALFMREYASFVKKIAKKVKNNLEVNKIVVPL